MKLAFNTSQRICLAIPDAFVSPKMWSTYSDLLAQVLTSSDIQFPSDHCMNQNGQDLRHSLSENFLGIKRRNEAMLFRGPIAQVSARLGAAVADVKVLLFLSH